MLDRRTLLKSIPFLSAIPWGKVEVPAKPVVEPPAAPDPTTIQIDIHFQPEDGPEVTIPAKVYIVSETVQEDYQTVIVKYRATVSTTDNPEIVGMLPVAFSTKPYGLPKTTRSPLRISGRMDHSQDITLIGDLYFT